MANTSGATVIFLQSHPAWVAARRRERERMEAMHRHPSVRGRKRATAAGSDGTPLVRHFTVCSSTDTPA